MLPALSSVQRAEILAILSVLCQQLPAVVLIILCIANRFCYLKLAMSCDPGMCLSYHLKPPQILLSQASLGAIPLTSVSSVNFDVMHHQLKDDCALRVALIWTLDPLYSLLTCKWTQCFLELQLPPSCLNLYIHNMIGAPWPQCIVNSFLWADQPQFVNDQSAYYGPYNQLLYHCRTSILSQHRTQPPTAVVQKGLGTKSHLLKSTDLLSSVYPHLCTHLQLITHSISAHPYSTYNPRRLNHYPELWYASNDWTVKAWNKPSTYKFNVQNHI